MAKTIQATETGSDTIDRENELRVGATAYDIPQLDGSGKLPASMIAVADAGEVFTATTVEAVLAEMEARIAALETP